MSGEFADYLGSFLFAGAALAFLSSVLVAADYRLRTMDENLSYWDRWISRPALLSQTLMIIGILLGWAGLLLKMLT
jgi:hypothetical protein